MVDTNKESPNMWDEMRLLFRGGKLWKKDGWRNVVEHQVIQMKEVKVISKLLNLSITDEKKLITVALLHDWEKRKDIKNDFSDQNNKNANEFLSRINPDEDLMLATGETFLETYNNGEATELQCIQFYLDDITKGSEIVTLDDRIDEAKASGRNPENDWELERQIGHKIEQDLWVKMVANGHKIEKPVDIPNYIKERINNYI
jgi:hypothetical protein